MHRVNIKPLSVNAAWRGGRRFKTQEHRDYEEELLYVLPKSVTVPDGPLELVMEVGFSNRLSDLSNVVKVFEDILQKCYSFNDNRVWRLRMEKRIVPKGEEYIAFELNPVWIAEETDEL